MASERILRVAARELFVGLMSGTSLDGVDAALVEFGIARPDADRYRLSASSQRPLKAELHRLQAAGPNELDRAARAGNELARLYADAALTLLAAGRHCACSDTRLRLPRANHTPSTRRRLYLANRQSCTAGRAHRHLRRCGFSQPRHRRWRPGGAVGTRVSRRCVWLGSEASRHRQYRRHRQPDRPAAARHGHWLRYRTGQRFARSVDPAASGRGA